MGKIWDLKALVDLFLESRCTKPGYKWWPVLGGSRLRKNVMWHHRRAAPHFKTAARPLRAGFFMWRPAHFTARQAFYPSLRLPLRTGRWELGGGGVSAVSFRSETSWKLACSTEHWKRMLTIKQTHKGHSLQAAPQELFILTYFDTLTVCNYCRAIFFFCPCWVFAILS